MTSTPGRTASLARSAAVIARSNRMESPRSVTVRLHWVRFASANQWTEVHLLGDSLSRHARHVAATIRVPSPFTVRALILEVERSRERPILLHPVDPAWARTSRWCGAWIEDAAADHIVYVRDPRSTSRNAMTILHELGHIVLDHSGSADPANLPVGRFGVAYPSRMRGRSGFSEPEERAAELFSTILLEAVTRHRPPDDQADPRVARLQSRLG